MGHHRAHSHVFTVPLDDEAHSRDHFTHNARYISIWYERLVTYYCNIALVMYSMHHGDDVVSAYVFTTNTVCSVCFSIKGYPTSNGNLYIVRKVNII